jgi:hypothetical protein
MMSIAFSIALPKWFAHIYADTKMFLIAAPANALIAAPANACNSRTAYW